MGTGNMRGRRKANRKELCYEYLLKIRCFRDIYVRPFSLIVLELNVLKYFLYGDEVKVITKEAK